ncbi:MAG TPA: UvrD-helicase domain-containing protein [Armatimonadota bacterium]
MNDAQLLAVTTRTPHVLVSAGAGSGKTLVLTQRYLELLTTDGLTTDQILTLTFTRKAAQEMRTRIAGELEAQGRAEERRALLRAPIGTIHSFCERLLREHALQAGIDPNFRLLDEAESHTLQESALDTVSETIWEGEGKHERDEIGRLLLDFSQRELRASLLEIFRFTRTHGLDIATLAPTPGADLSLLADTLQDTIEELLAVEGSGSWLAECARMRLVYADLQPLLAHAWASQPFNWLAFDQATLLANQLSTRSGPKTAQPLKNAVKEAREHWLAACLDFAARPYLDAFILFLRRFTRVYQLAKEAQSLLDFEDLLLETRKLLLQPGSALDHYGRQFRQVMVDEFQDTNALHFDVVNALRGDGHLFTVGDVKQAIYRFIGSDVRVFLAQERRIAELGANGQRIPLSLNYRTRPELLGILNGLFARLWGEDVREDGFRFEPLATERQFIPRDIPTLEIAFRQESEGDAASLRDRETLWIARRMLQLTGYFGDAPLQITARQSDPAAPPASCPLTFGDIILLFRASTDIPRYEEALLQAGIPYYVVSGRGFYQAREVQDLVHLLRVLDNPLDDFSLAVVLRSPLVGVSDDTLFWLSRDWSEWTAAHPCPAEIAGVKYGRLWAALAQVDALTAIPENDRQALLQFRALVAELQQAMPAGHPLDLIDTVLERTGYATALLAAPGGDQSYANLQKLREVAATFQSRGIFDLSDFQRYLTQLEEMAPREVSAPLDVEGGNVVRLMTIHAAKGLEAPVVFLADCGRNARGGGGTFLLDEQGGLTCKVPLGDGEWGTPFTYQQAIRKQTEEDRWEGERLLYVALTRAQEHLICCGFTNYPEEDKRNSYADILAGLLGLDGPVDENIDIDFSYAGVNFPLRIWSADALATVEALTPPVPALTLWERYPREILAGEALPLVARGQDVEAFEQVTARFQTLISTRLEGELRLGVLKTLCYEQCPRQYWLRFVFHGERSNARVAIPAARDEAARAISDDDEDERMDGTRYGKALHTVMQSLAEAHWQPDRLDTVLTSLASTPDESFTSAEIAQVRDTVERFLALPICSALRNARSTYPELAFITLEGGIYLSGKIDLLACVDGAWWIVDYKTGDKHRNQHFRQLGMYALAVRQALGVDPARLLLVYVDQDQPIEEYSAVSTLIDDSRQLILRVRDGIRQKDFHPRPERQRCEYCEYNARCPEGNALVQPGIADERVGTR